MRLYLDACAIIYAIEGRAPFRDAVVARVQEVEKDPTGVLITSRLSRLECRVKPLRDNNAQLLGHYEGFLARRPVELSEISAAIIERATALRVAHGFKTPDAIHLATAIESRAEVFLTGDAGLARCAGIRGDVIS